MNILNHKIIVAIIIVISLCIDLGKLNCQCIRPCDITIIIHVRPTCIGCFPDTMKVPIIIIQ